MEKIIEYFALNPVHLAIALVLAFIVLFSFVKKLLKLSMVIIAIFIIYIAYLTEFHTATPKVHLPGI